MSTLSVITQVLAFDDEATNTSNPSQKAADWKRSLQNLPVGDPRVEKLSIEALGSLTIFDGTRSLSTDGTSAFSLALSSLDPSRYRLTHTGGTDPVFRVDRSVDCSGIALTITVLANQTVTVVAGSGTPFSGVQVGDTVLIPGIPTGDSSSPFDLLNNGYWSVLTASSTELTLSRASGSVFEGKTEVVTPSAANQLKVYSSTGVQVGDTLALSAGFAASSLRSFSVLAVTSDWLEFASTSPLGAQAGIIPTAAGLTIYTNSKRFVYLEVDQECVVRCNGDAGNSNQLTPWVAGDPSKVAQFMKTGATWKLELVNKSNAKLKAFVVVAE